MSQEQVFEQIKQDTESNDVVLYMKGTAMFPQCGFSAAAVQALSETGVTFKDINVLADPGLREGLKEYSNWPTFPQLYVKGELIGGCDIVREMAATGELKQLLDDKGIALSA